LVLTFFAYAIAIGAVAIGWHLIMYYVGEQHNLLLNIKIYVYTLVARRMPGTLWYVAGRAILYQRLGISGRVTTLASGIEIVLGIVAGFMVGLPALFLQLGLSWVSIAVFTFIEAIGLVILYPPLLCKLLSLFSYYVDPKSITIRTVLAWLCSYVSMWISGGIMTCTVVAALYPLSWGQIPTIISLWSLTGVISYSVFLLPSNLGATEIALSVMLSHIIPLPIAVATAILVRILTTVFDIGWSSLILLDRNRQLFATSSTTTLR
jgi:hypothetical protein